MNAAEVMSRDVLTIDAETSVLEAARTMLQHRVSGLPVVDRAGKLVGMLTEGDLLRRAETGTERHRGRWLELLLGPGRAAADYTATHARKVSEVMSDRVVAIAPDTPLDRAVALMERDKIKRLPVVAEGKLVGIVTRADFLRALIDHAEKLSATGVSDDDIRERVLAELNRQSWAPRAAMRVDVKDGVVAFSGTITDERERLALRVMCENIAGVKGVVDNLAWVDPLSGIAVEPPETKGR